MPALKQLARTSPNQLARIHALWTLEGLASADAALVRELMKHTDPQIRIQAIRASETLYKAGDRSFANDYKAMATDADTDVVMQALLTLNTLKVRRRQGRHLGRARGQQDQGRAAHHEHHAQARRQHRPRRGDHGGHRALHGRGAGDARQGAGNLHAGLLRVSWRRRARRQSAGGSERRAARAAAGGVAARARSSGLRRQGCAARCHRPDRRHDVSRRHDRDGAEFRRVDGGDHVLHPELVRQPGVARVAGGREARARGDRGAQGPMDVGGARGVAPAADGRRFPVEAHGQPQHARPRSTR